MKKTFASFFMLLAAAMPAAAVSTCETRVDAHQDATTKQRVVYCLTPEQEPASPQGPQVLYHSVTDKTPAPQSVQEETDREPAYFNKEGVFVEHYFRGTKQFPPFENESLSVQEGLASKEEGRQAAACKEAKCEAQMDAILLAEGMLEDGLAQESAAGIKARKTKPSRFMKEVVQADFSQSADPYASAGYAPANTMTNPSAYGPQAAPSDPYAAYQPSYQQPDYTQPGANPYATDNTQPGANPYATDNTQPAAGVNPYAGGASADAAYAAPVQGMQQ